MRNLYAMRQQFKRFRQLPTAEQRLLWQALCWLPLAHGGVRAVGFKSGCRLLQRFSAWLGHPAPPNQPLPAIAQCTQALNRAIHYGLYPGNCLSRALTLWWLLSRCGLHSDLRIGVRMLDGRFQAHAWLEYEGQPLNEVLTVRQEYTAFADELFAALL